MSAGEQWFTEINNVGQNYKHSDCFAVDFYCHISYLLLESKAGEIFSKVVGKEWASFPPQTQMLLLKAVNYVSWLF